MSKSEPRLTLAQLAQLAGVSTSTASRALANNPLIKQQTREKVQALAREHNYSVNAAASRLRTRKTHVVAVILNLIEHTEQSITDPFLLKIVGDLNKALNARGYELLLSNSFMATDDWANYFISSQRADGMIVIGQGKSTEKIDNAASAGVPLVVWGEPKTQAPYPIVGGDNYAGGYQATDCLIRHGARRIMFLGDPEHAEMRERYNGYCQAHRDHQLERNPALTAAIDITSKTAYDYISDWIREHGLSFDGIVCISDMVALGALKALKERYVSIPGDVSIIGYDDISLAELMHPSLTTIRQNTQQAAEAMVAELINQFEGKPANPHVIETTLITRRSTPHDPD
ncbi:LacI family DNA-binding transcriptional regulator [Alteromonas halophila]|uniref:LacI family transcriptional regulator n=1 Tax=Alteromonas halophila TaxID=516698 RepID=A0A918MXG5_9ALTE|nr:LacI family DNA-binding transcriptional regulator [Alteromonas halophila]GGW83836.1 LacI family transcriptional regulator [Alteromonas halophila]